MALRYLFFILFATAVMAKFRYHMYLTGQHNVVPERSLVSDITHVALAFMSSKIFNEDAPSSWPLFTTVAEVRPKFPTSAAIMVAIGGWGDTEGFEIAAKTQSSRDRFARNVKAMVDATGADGVDIDWEYPGGNGEDYILHPNPTKSWQIPAFPLLLSAIRHALGPHALISAAIPGLPRDMLAFTPSSIPALLPLIDFFNIMTYDLMNRRDNVTKHHAGIAASRTALETYAANGIPRGKMNLGFAFYVKWFRTSLDEDWGGCEKHPVGCRTALLEDPETGADLGRAGGFSWHDSVPGDVREEWARAQAGAQWDGKGGGEYYWDKRERRWWTWESERAVERKATALLSGLGGAFAWGLGEDADEFVHFRALTGAVRKYIGAGGSDQEKPLSEKKDEL